MFKDGHQSAIVSSCSYTKKYLLTGGSDGRITIWNLETGLMAKTFETGNDEVKQILVSDNLVITSGN
jgi:WD40 repeat protein